MTQLSPKDLVGETRTRWTQARKELFRGVLRDPGASTQAKVLARQKISEAQVLPPHFVDYPPETSVEPMNGAF